MIDPLVRRFDEDPSLAAIPGTGPPPEGLEWIEGVELVEIGPLRWALMARRLFRVPWDSGEIPAADGFGVRARLDWALCWNESASTAVARHLGGIDGSTGAIDLFQTVRHRCEQIVSSWITSRKAGSLVGTDGSTSLRRILESPEGGPVSIVGFENLTVESPALVRHRRNHAAEAVRQSAAKLAVVRMASGWRLAQEEERLVATERPAVAVSPPPPILVTSGSRLLSVLDGRIVDEVETGGHGLGGVRSVRVLQDGTVIVGSREGVLCYREGLRGEPSVFPCPRASRSGRGANDSALVGKTLMATHGEHGLVSWHVDRPDRPGLVMRRFRGARGILSCHKGVLVAAGEGIHDPHRATPLFRTPGEITSFTHDRTRILAGTRSGELTSFQGGSPPSIIFRTTRPILGLAGYGWDEGPLLAVGACETSVRLIDSQGMTRRVLSSPNPVGMLLASTRGLAALSVDRRVLIIWVGDGETPQIWTMGRPASDLSWLNGGIFSRFSSEKALPQSAWKL